jgi:hypothetical protein
LRTAQGEIASGGGSGIAKNVTRAVELGQNVATVSATRTAETFMAQTFVSTVAFANIVVNATNIVCVNVRPCDLGVDVAAP